MAANEWDTDREYHESLVADSARADDQQNVYWEQIRMTPLFSADVLAHVRRVQPGELRQYSFLAKILQTSGDQDEQIADDAQTHDWKRSGVALHPNNGSYTTKAGDSRLFVNMSTPWSAFICGSQGSGKSHTLSCMLEAALRPSRLGKLPNPLAGMVFHFDKSTAGLAPQICEAAYLCSTGIPVTVLVSSANFHCMKSAYENMNIPGLHSNASEPVVAPRLLEEKHLNIQQMLTLMAVKEKEGNISLYMESVCRVLRSMAMKNKNNTGLSYKDFKDKLDAEHFVPGQQLMLNMRLQLLESFMSPLEAQGQKKSYSQKTKWLNNDDAQERAEIAKAGIWSFQPGSLTIVDLSCPFLDESAACSLFDICLTLFLKGRGEAGRIVALDEAHRFMTGTDSSAILTESLISVIRQQRHLATRVIVATQEPTISSSLLDLCSMTIVHRFTSPAWHEALKSHLAAISNMDEGSSRDGQGIFKQIVRLNTGQAFIFCPSAMIGVDKNQDGSPRPRMFKLGTRYIKALIRKRESADGGRSILAA